MKVGITGHRFFNESRDPLFLEQVTATCLELESKSGQQKPSLITGLAIGADLIVSKVALGLGWDLVGVIPVPLDDYLKDFESEFDRNQFLSIYYQCQCIEVAAPRGTPSPDRYCILGLKLAGAVDVLIAVWDEDTLSLKPGGTGWVIQEFLKLPVHSMGDVRVIAVTR